VILLHAPLPGAERMQTLLIGHTSEFRCTNRAAAATALSRVWENWARRSEGPRNQAELLHIIGYDEACIEEALSGSRRRRAKEALMDESTASAIGAATRYQHCQ
jgi:hypothetical protein